MAERDFHIGKLRFLLRDGLDDQQGTDHQQNGDGQADEPVLDKPITIALTNTPHVR